MEYEKTILKKLRNTQDGFFKRVKDVLAVFLTGMLKTVEDGIPKITFDELEEPSPKDKGHSQSEMAELLVEKGN